MARLTGKARKQHRKELKEARERRQALEAAHPPRALNINAAAIERRNAIAAALLSYYEFLTTLYLPTECLKRPPPEGWPSITAEHLAFLNKTDEAIDILKHIPYICEEGTIREGYQIYELCVCIDYRGEAFERRAVDYQARDQADPIDLMDDGSWPNLKEPQHIVTLARSAVADNGFHMFLDTRDATVVLVDFTVGNCTPDASVQERMENLKRGFRNLSIFPIAPDDVCIKSRMSLTEGRYSQVREAFLQHGWPGEDYRKEECMVAVKKFWDSFQRRAN